MDFVPVNTGLLVEMPWSGSFFLLKCVTCRHLRGNQGEQKMADLPKSRTEPAPPFTYCGVDFFGLWHVQQRRAVVKRQGSLFTCLASSAAHKELADSLETYSFIKALRRFICRRGPVREISLKIKDRASTTLYILSGRLLWSLACPTKKSGREEIRRLVFLLSEQSSTHRTGGFLGNVFIYKSIETF